MSAQGKLMIFCAEQYKAAKHLTGKQLAELLSRYSAFLLPRNFHLFINSRL